MSEDNKNFFNTVSEKVTDVLDGEDNQMGTEDDLAAKAKAKTKEVAGGIAAKVKDVLDGPDNIAGTGDDPLEKAKESAKGAFEKVKDMFDDKQG